MRILHVISSLDRRAGGPPVAMTGLAVAQAALGQKVSVAATFAEGADRELADDLRRAGVAVTLIGPATGKFQQHRQIRPILSALIAQADVVHIHTLWEEIQHQAATIARDLCTPYIFTPHGMLDPWSLSQSYWIKRAYLFLRLRRDLNGAMFLHALNRDEAALVEPLKLKPECEIIPNGIDRDQLFSPATRTFRTSFPQLGEHPFVLFLSRLHPKKGLDYLADAFAVVARAMPEVRLVVAGPDDGAEQAFDQRIAAAGLQGRVIRVGPIYGEDKRSALAEAAVFVLPSRQEGFSVAIVEALAAGTPVVISEACHFPEVAEAGAGLVVPLSAEAVADGLLKVLRADSESRERRRSTARDLAGRFTWDRIAARAVSFYGRPSLAIIANSMTPYRIALHRRIAREIPGLRLHSLFTHAESNAPWELNPPAEINPVSFAGVSSAWRRGGEMIGWLLRNRPAAVIVNGYNDASRLRVLRWCRRRGLPAHLWGDSNIRGDRATGAKAILKNIVVRWAVRQAAGVLPCGSLGQQYFEKYGADPKKILWMPYEPDYELIQQLLAEQIEEVKQRFHFLNDRRRIVYSGRLIAIKRVDLLLAAFADIAEDRPEWDLVVVGDGPLANELKASVPASIQSRVTWTGFIGSQSVVSAIYRCCDVLAHPADVEPWALVINEAAAAGLAIVASDAVGAAAELVRDGANGRIFPAGEKVGLRSALLNVTMVGAIDRFRSQSQAVLAAWRTKADPVNAVRRLMERAGGPNLNSTAADASAERGH